MNEDSLTRPRPSVESRRFAGILLVVLPWAVVPARRVLRDGVCAIRLVENTSDRVGRGDSGETGSIEIAYSSR